LPPEINIEIEVILLPRAISDAELSAKMDAILVAVSTRVNATTWLLLNTASIVEAVTSEISAV